MPRKNHNPHQECRRLDQTVWEGLQMDLCAAQAAVADCVVGRPFEIPAARHADIALSFWREGITYFTDNPHINYLVQDDVRAATRHHRSEVAITEKIAAQVSSAHAVAKIMRTAISVVELSSDPNSEGTHMYGVVALCEEAWLHGSDVRLDIAEEARAVRIGLVDDSRCSNPQLWLGSLTVKPDLLDFAVEQFENNVPRQLAVGPVQLIRRS